jgi:hypothetical protein
MTRSITLDDRRLPLRISAPIQPLRPLHGADGVVARTGALVPLVLVPSWFLGSPTIR